jgi:HSP20 family protein
MNKVSKQTQSNVAQLEPTAERQVVSPEVNIHETKDAFVLQAEMAGVNKEGLEITLDGNVLTFVGRPRREAPGPDLIYRESRDVDYRRIFELDPSIDVGRIEARMDQGVLTLTLPKVERAKPRRISVG